MEFDTWLAANGFDPATVSTTQKLALQPAWRASQNPAPAAQPEPTPAPAAAASGTFDEVIATARVEDDRRRSITTLVATSLRENPDQIADLERIGRLAIDGKWSPQQTELALLRAGRGAGPNVFSRSAPSVDADVLEAAVCVSARVPNVEKHFDERTLQAAHTRFRRGIGLKELLVLAAERNSGYRGSMRDDAALCRAAFRQSHGDPYGLSASGPSTISVSGILSNLANKSLAANFLFTEQAWREIASIRTANDFKTMTTYRLTGAAKFEKVAPGGEIKHGTLGQLSYENRVDTYGKQIGIDRRDIRNDDLGAFSNVLKELARGAGDSLNEVFWETYLDDASFYSSGNANLTQDTALAVLNTAGLDAMEIKFRNQTKPDGTPFGISPAILLVGPAQKNTALTLMGSPLLIGGSSTVPGTNVFNGRYKVVDSVYVGQTAIGGLSTNWWLLADPRNVSTIEVAFLDGIDSPVVETSEFDFDRLGLSMRAYMDVGAAKTEFRAGQKSNGEAS